MPTDTESNTLLEWINNSFSLGTSIRSFSDLNDGCILWEILQDIDTQHFLGVLPENSPSDQWVSRWQNLKHIQKHLLAYLRTQYDGEVPAGLSTRLDLQAIAEKAAAKETNQLLKMFLMAAIRSPRAMAYITTMQQLSTSTQEGLKDIIQEAQNPSEDRLDQVNYEQDEYRARRDLAMDPELQFEERVGKLLAENDKLSNEKKELEKALEDLNNRISRLQENNDTLQDRLASTEDRLATLKSGKGDLGQNTKGFQNTSQDIIAAQEQKLSAAQDELDSLRMSMESLRVKNQRYQTLQDDYDEVKTERDQLARKANAAEKYRQKLQASQDFEKENQTLKDKVKHLQQQLKESDSAERISAGRDVEIEDYRQLVARIEQDRHEIQNVKKELEFNNHALHERLEAAEERNSRDEDTIGGLHERIRELEGLESPSTPGTSTPKAEETLQRDLDLEQIGKREAQLIAENEELKKELEKAKSAEQTPPPATTSEEDQAKPASTVEKWNPDFYKCMLKTDGELQDNHTELHHEYTTLQTKLVDLESRLESSELRLYDASVKLGLAEKDKLEIVDEAQSNTVQELTTLRNECGTLRNSLREAHGQLTVRQLQLDEISGERDGLRDAFDKSQAKLQTEDEESVEQLKKLLEDANSGANNASDDPGMTSDFLERLAETTERSADNLTKRAEHVSQLNDRIQSLQDRIKHYEEFAADHEETKASKERETELMQVIQRQAREIALISSAWYEFQSRLQNGSVTISRYRGAAANHADNNKTWLSKQRALVGALSGRAGGR